MTALKPRKPSLADFTNKYCNNDEACYDFFWNAKYPDGNASEKCGCTHCYKIIRHNVTACAECGQSTACLPEPFSRTTSFPSTNCC